MLFIAGRFETDGTGDGSRGRTESGRVGRSVQVGREARGRRERERGESLMEGGDVLRRGVVIVQSQWRARGGKGGRREERGCCARIRGHVFAVSRKRTGRDLPALSPQ